MLTDVGRKRFWGIYNTQMLQFGIHALIYGLYHDIIHVKIRQDLAMFAIDNQKNGEELLSPDLINRITNGMLSLMPLYDYLITLDSDPRR